MQKPSIPKGTRDFGPAVAARRQYIIDTIAAQFINYGFHKIETPAMENLSVLTGKYGEEGDQLLFKILNSGDYLKKSSMEDFQQGSGHLQGKISEKGLRYDLTVPFARFVAMHQHELTFPFKRYQIQPVWRADRPQKGRYREFYQCDADIIGSNSLWNEVEITLLIHDVFEALRLSDISVKINHREVLFAMASKAGMQGQEIPFCVALDKLDKIGTEQVLKEIAEQGGNEQTVRSLLEIIGQPGTALDKIKELSKQVGSGPGFDHLISYFESLANLNDRSFNVELDFSLARGLTYYTGMIFEVKPTTVKMGSICGGGRYDDLTGLFGLKDMSGVGISFGLDRIYDVLDELDLFPPSSLQGPEVLIVHFDQNAFAHGSQILDRLRKEKVRAEIYPDQFKLKKQLGYANKLRIPYVITVGDSEIASETYPLKDMETGQQETITLTEIIERLGRTKSR